MRINLLGNDGVTADTEGDVIEPRTKLYRPGITALVQVEHAGTADVAIQGRIDDTYAWVQLGDLFEADGAAEVVLFPQMRAVVTNYSAGTIRAALWA